MFPVKEHFRCGDHEYILLRKGDAPRLVELPRLDEELEEGAEFYPRDEEQKEWILIPFEHFRELEREGCLEKCLTEELEEVRRKSGM